MEITEHPVLTTLRLVLRPFTLADAAAVQPLAGTPEVASTTLNIPHPYEDSMAEDWIGTHAAQFQEGGIITYAVTLRDEDVIIGAVSLGVTRRNPASGRVMHKVGMEHEGTLRQHFLKGDGFEDVEVYGLLAEGRRQARQLADALKTT